MIKHTKNIGILFCLTAVLSACQQGGQGGAGVSTTTLNEASGDNGTGNGAVNGNEVVNNGNNSASNNGANVTGDSSPDSVVGIMPENVAASPFPTPLPVENGSIGVPLTAYQDKLYSVDLSQLSSPVATITMQNAPPWLAFNPVTRKLEGVPEETESVTLAAAITNLNILVTSINGASKSFGPYNVTVNKDPLKKYQWHLKNTGQKNFSKNAGKTGQDMTMAETVRSGLTGLGVVIAVSDTGVDGGHPDLRENMSAKKSKNYALPSPYFGDPTPKSTDPTMGHGTAVAGIIGAVGWNNIGVRGVAPKSTIAGLRFIGTSQTEDAYLDQAGGEYDIFNYSYGGTAFFPPDEDALFAAQLRNGVTTLRGGKGAVYVKAAGNEFTSQFDYDTSSGLLPCFNVGDTDGGPKGSCLYMGNANLSDAANVRPEIIIAAAINANGSKSSYSSPGSNVWISGFGGEYGDDNPAIMTVDVQTCSKGFSSALKRNSFETNATLNPNCNYTSAMNGTSSATPSITGVVALLLEANPNLTWRDIKYILASTASLAPDGSHSHPYDYLNLSGQEYQYGWLTNRAGFRFHNWYGFGRVNVDAAVSLAKNYVSSLSEQKSTTDENGNWLYSSNIITPQLIPDNSATGTTSTINVTDDLVIEAVQVKFTTDHQVISDLMVELTSPSGMKSILLNYNSGIVKNDTLTYDALLLSNAFFGEHSNGIWTLKVLDGHEKFTGKLKSWQINVIGH